MVKKTADIIEIITDRCAVIETGFTVYYEQAPDNASYPYGVVSALRDNGDDTLSFALDVWTEQGTADATEDLEDVCDEARGALDGYSFVSATVGGGHIFFTGRDTVTDSDKEISHRRLNFDCTVIYI